MSTQDAVKEEILKAVVGAGRPSAIKEIERSVGLERHTLSKYLHLMLREGFLSYETVGRAKLWKLNKAPIISIFQSDHESMGYVEQVLVNLASQLPVQMFVIDNQYTIQFMNVLAEKNYGAGMQTLFYETVLGFENPLKLTAVRQVVEGKRSSGDQEVITSRQRILDIRATELKNPDGSRSVILLVDDVTEQRRAERHERFLAALVEGTDDAVIGQGLNGIMTSWNPAATRLYGYKEEEVLGKNISMLVPKERRREFNGIMKSVAEGKRISNLRTTRVKKNREIVHVDITVSPVKDAVGKLVGASDIERDKTEQMEWESAITMSEVRYHTLFNMAPFGIVLCSVTGKIILVNDTLAALVGYEPTDLVGKNVGDFLVGTGQNALDGGIKELIKEKKRYKSRYIVRCSDNSTVHLEVNSAIIEENGVPIELVAFVGKPLRKIEEAKLPQ